MYIPIRAHFRHMLEMGLGYLHIGVESKLLVLTIKASSKATSCGTSNDKAPAFFIYQHHISVRAYGHVNI